MKKATILFAIVCATICLSAQNVKESTINFGKEQLQGYLLDVSSANVDLTESALRDKFEKQYNLKASKENGFRAYLNQAFAPFGTQNFDIYFNVSEYGKKKHKTTQVALIVCSGNHNAITSSNHPETAMEIKNFLVNFVKYIDDYVANQEIAALEAQIAKLNKDLKDLNGNQDKLTKQLNKLNKEIEENNTKISDKEKEIKKVEEELNQAKKRK